MTLLLIPKDESHVSYVIKYLLSCLLSINIIISNSVIGCVDGLEVDVRLMVMS